MSEDTVKKFSESNPNKLDLILLTLQRLQEDLLVAKCEIKTAVRDVGQQHNYLQDALFRIRRDTGSVNVSTQWNSNKIDRIHQLDAPRSISYTAKRSNY